MNIPTVAIIGRPNVGKSSLLNSLAGQMISIVEPTAGVTRDRVSVIVECKEQYFELVDTGGFGIVDHDNLAQHIEAQISTAITRADLVLFVVDIREGITPLDKKIAEMLRTRTLKTLLVANKADNQGQEPMAGEFFALGYGQPICVSAQNGRNCQKLLEVIIEKLEGHEMHRPANEIMKLAVVGKRNVGKSTFINQLAGEERVIVSEIPGTTRDAIDVRFEKDGRTFVAIDTAGIRKITKMNDNNSIEFYSFTRATRSVRRADVALMFLDAEMAVSQVDKKLAQYIAQHYKPCIIVINKWDLAKDQANTEQYREYLDKVLPELSYAPLCFITAREGKNVQSLLDLAQQLYKQANTTVTTAQLNKVIQAITSERAPSARRKVGLPKIYYGTQVTAAPPSILIFVNDPRMLDNNYRRYLVNRLRETLPFSEIPIRLLLRGHHEGAEGKKVRR